MPILFELLVITVVVLVSWQLVANGLFAPQEVRRLRKMKKALKAQLRAKKEVLRLRQELGDLQAALDQQETSEMQQLEDLISSINSGERPTFRRGDQSREPVDDETLPADGRETE